MKGALGLMVAAGLGIVGAICNWFYLDRLARDQEKVSFIAVRQGVNLDIGDNFKESQFEQVDIPRSGVGNLDHVAPLWSARNAVVGLRANRQFVGGEIILESDLIGPAQMDLADTLQQDEVARWVPVDPSSVVAAQINPNDFVSFEVPRLGPTPAGGSPGPVSAGGGGSTEIIGPFRVLALGNRRERPNVQKAATGRVGSENTMAIVVKFAGGEMEERARRLFEALRLAGGNGAHVILHSSREEPLMNASPFEGRQARPR